MYWGRLVTLTIHIVKGPVHTICTGHHRPHYQSSRDSLKPHASTAVFKQVLYQSQSCSPPCYHSGSSSNMLPRLPYHFNPISKHPSLLSLDMLEPSPIMLPLLLPHCMNPKYTPHFATTLDHPQHVTSFCALPYQINPKHASFFADTLDSPPACVYCINLKHAPHFATTLDHALTCYLF